MLVQAELPESPLPSDRPKPTKPLHARGVTRERLLTLARCGFRCAYCGVDLLRDVSTLHGATIDHVWPKSHGGNRSRGNVVACCYTCNQFKGSYQPEDIEDARAHIAAKRSEYVAYFLQVAEYHAIEIPSRRRDGLSFREDLIGALGTFAGQAGEILRRLAVFETQAQSVLSRFAVEPSETPQDHEKDPIFRELFEPAKAQSPEELTV